MRYKFEFLADYTLTEYTVGLLVCGWLLIGFEYRPNFPPDDREFPDSGGCVGVVVANRWVGWTKGGMK